MEGKLSCTTIQLEDTTTVNTSNFFCVVHKGCNKVQTYLSSKGLSPLHCYRAKIPLMPSTLPAHLLPLSGDEAVFSCDYAFALLSILLSITVWI